MSTETGRKTLATGQYKPALLFLVSCVALTTGGMVFSLRATCMEDWGTLFALDAKSIGLAVGYAFLAFAISVFIGSPLCDFLGMGRLLGLAALLHIGGTVLTILTPSLQGSLSPYLNLSIAMFTVGLAHGLVEAVINPLIATIYADDKTHRLNVLHAWWPGGLIIGGLIGFALHQAGMNWQWRMGVILVPSVIYGALVLVTKFPPTERVAAGVADREMWMEALRPLFIVWFLCMWLTAATELGPGQWVDATLSKTVGFAGILVLVYVSGLMFVLRHFAGPLAQRLSPVGLMWLSSLLAGLGLMALSAAKSPIPALLAATVWGAGVCYMWPTMLGVVSERFPKGGAWLLGLMGSAGNLSTYLVLPLMGRAYDVYTQRFLPAGEQLQALINQAAQKTPVAEQAKQTLDAARTQAVPFAFRYVAALAIVLIVVFGIIWLRDRAAGGYRVVRLQVPGAEEEPAQGGAAGAAEAGEAEGRAEEAGIGGEEASEGPPEQ